MTDSHPRVRRGITGLRTFLACVIAALCTLAAALPAGAAAAPAAGASAAPPAHRLALPSPTGRHLTHLDGSLMPVARHGPDRPFLLLGKDGATDTGPGRQALRAHTPGQDPPTHPARRGTRLVHRR